MKNEHETIYEVSPLEVLTRRYSELQRLHETGIYVDNLLEQTWGEIKDLIESDDKVRLGQLRKELCLSKKTPPSGGTE